MAKQPALLAVALLSCGACASEAPDAYDPMTVELVSAKIKSWNGRTVSVRGWLTSPCGGLSCAISSVPVKPNQDWPDTPILSIAAETLVEPALADHQGKQVVLRGVLSSECRSKDMLCFDRAPDITPISVRLVETANKDK